MPSLWYFCFMAKYTPETGFITFSLDNPRPYSDDDILEFNNGTSVTGAQYNQMIQNYQNSERGKRLLAYMRGEASEPKPLMTLAEMLDGEKRAFLGDGEVDVTDVDPDVSVPLDELFPSNENY